MQTPRNDRRVSDRPAQTRSQATRRHRTLSAPGCESLELRKLMTGFAGAGGMMMPHSMPAEMGDMNGGEWHGARGWHANDEQSSTADTATQGNDQGMMATSQLKRDFAGGDRGGSGGEFREGLAFGRRDESGGMGGDRSMGGMADRFDRGDDQGMGDQGMGDAPMSSQTQAGTTGNTQLDTDFTKLRTDEQAIHDKSQVTPALLASVRKDLEAIDKAKTGTADATALKTLQTDEQTIFSGQTAPTDAQRTQLQADRDAVLKSQGVSQTLIDQLAADRLAVKTASNFTSDDQATLDADHAAIEKDRAAAQPTGTDSSTTATDAATPPAATDSSTTTAAAATPDATAPAAATPDATAPAAATPATTTTTATATPDQTAAATTATTTATTSTPTTTTTTTTDGEMNRGWRGDMARHGRPMVRAMGEGMAHFGQTAMNHGHHGRRGPLN